MDTSKIKEIFNKMSFLKNYSAFILPVILLVVFLIVQFGFGTILSKKFKGRIEKESIRKGSQLSSLSSQDIARNQWEVEKAYMDAFEADTNKILDIVKHTGQRELLSYKIFPEPKDTSILIYKEFGKNYRQAINDLFEKNRVLQRPSDFEIEKALEQSKSPASTTSRSRRFTAMPNFRRNSSRSFDQMDSLGKKIIKSLCEATARKASFYADPVDIPGYDYWEEAPVNTEEDRSTQQEHYEYKSIRQSTALCWYWQLGYWIIEDIFKTISSMNSDFDNVLDAPVKRLMSIDFGGSSQLRGSVQSTTSNPPYYVTDNAPGMIISYTGRKSDPSRDVVHFKLSVVLDAQKVLGFMKQLSSEKEHTFKGWYGTEPEKTFAHNQITVLQATTSPVDTSDAKHKFYSYGDGAVVKLELVCEYIFERDSYKYTDSEGNEKTIMPDFIVNREKIEEEQEDY